MNFIPFHSIGLCDDETTIPAPYFLDSLNITGVGTIPKSKTSIPFFIRIALIVSCIIIPDGLVSLPITHFFDLINDEKLLENSITSFRLRSFPNTPLIPEIVFFNYTNSVRLFINSDGFIQSCLGSSAR